MKLFYTGKNSDAKIKEMFPLYYMHRDNVSGSILQPDIVFAFLRKLIFFLQTKQAIKRKLHKY